MELPAEFLSEVESKFPRRFLSLDPADLEAYGRDWIKSFVPAPGAVAFPASTDEVATLLRLCSKHRVPVVPSGGRTGLAGGATAVRGELVLSLSRMSRMDAVDTLAQTVRVQAGAVTQAVHEHCLPHGLTWPVDFASKGSSQVGGNIATNAGGVRVLRYGLTRNWVLGVQVVLVSGAVLELNGALVKNSTGPDLRHLFIGSEGILGVITEATLKLTPVPRAKTTVFAGFSGLEACLELFRRVPASGAVLQAYEMLTHGCLQAVVEGIPGSRSPMRQAWPLYGLIEFEGELTDSLATWLEADGLIGETAVAQSPAEARAFWALRENITEAMVPRGVVHKNDVSVPVASMGAFMPEMERCFSEEAKATGLGFELFVFGHIGDGNLHVYVTSDRGAVSKDQWKGLVPRLDERLFSLIRSYKGSVSAEHGVGLLKKPWLEYSRSAEEIQLLRAIKDVFDPDRLMNPGKVIDLAARA